MSDTKKVALITGANKGIGFEIARQLGAQGITILVGVRDRARGEDAVGKLRSEGVDAHAVRLDVTDQATIDEAARYINDTYGRLDILVNNAGISLREWGTPPSELDIAALRKTYETNFFAVFAVTKAMLPLLRHSEAGRIVNMSSEMGSLTLHSDTNSVYGQLPPTFAYNSSKTAVNALTVFFAKELRTTNMKINSVSPGYCATDLNNHSGPRTAEQGAQIAVKLATIGIDGPNGRFFDENGIVAW